MHVGLWCREAPKACRSFIQAALNGHYSGSTFYRLVPDFSIQAGLKYPSEALEDIPIEQHQRIHFNRRGLLATAPLDQTSHSKKTNCSEFIFTLAAAPTLKDSCTIFGKVVGDSLFSLMNIAEMDIEEGTEDRPVFCVAIDAIEVVQHPFEDLQPKEPQKKAVVQTNPNLLSFSNIEESPPTTTTKRPIESVEGPPISRLQAIHLSYKDIATFGKCIVDERQLMQKLKAFKSKIHMLETKQQKEQREAKVENVKECCALHCIVNCQSCERSEGCGEGGDEGSWLSHKLVFPQ